MEIKTTLLGRIMLVDEENNTRLDITDDCIRATVLHMKTEHYINDKSDDESFGYEYDGIGALHYFK